ncbi:MAG: T9SS type A sorting domain-containing protein, partial [Bacteroidetes bacterium]|nr:T9SS type A sorting domain-containing protein [Bacteroidota bacterium]
YNGNTWQNLGLGGSSSIVQYPNVNTIYRTIATSGVCKTDSSNKSTITVDSIAVGGLASVSSSNICIGDSVLLSLSNSKGTIKWQKLVNGVWSNLSSSSVNYKVAPSAFSTYRAWVSSGSCFVDSSNEVDIYVSPKSVSGNFSANAKNICAGDSVKLSLSGYTGRISWELNNGGGWQSMADTLDQLTVAPSITTTYRAVLSSGKCSKDTTTAYQINVTPNAVAGTLSASANSICIGDSVYISISGYTGFISWQENNGTGWQFFGNNQNSQYVKPTKNYQYRVILTSGSCSKDTSSIVSVVVTPNANAGVISSNIKAICPGGFVQLINTGSIGTKDWEKNDGSQWISLGTTKDTIQVNPNVKTSYRVISTTACGVSISSIYVVDVYTNPTAAIAPGGPLDYCNGDSALLQSSKAVQYSWSNGSTSQGTVIKSTSSIYVVVTDSNGCKDTSNTNVYTFHSPATPSLTRQGDSLVATPVGASLYIWKIGANTVATSSTNILLPKTKGIYTVEYKDQYGCLSSTSNTFDFSFIGVQSVASTLAEVNVWPNPSTGIFNLKISGLKSFQSLLKLTDLAGKSIIQRNQTLTSGEVFINIDLKEYAKGIYILYLEDENGMLITPVKLIKE